jgi:hypothetical protein
MFLTLFSGIFGGLLRLAPELLKWLDRKDDRAHELDMQDKQLEFLKLQGQTRVDEIQTRGDVDTTIEQLRTIAQLNQSQAQMAVAGGGLAAAISSLVRPLVTFFIFGMWGAHKVAVMLYAYNATGDLVDTLVNAWTVDDAALLSMIASFWFVGRVLDKRNGTA